MTLNVSKMWGNGGSQELLVMMQINTASLVGDLKISRKVENVCALHIFQLFHFYYVP